MITPEQALKDIRQKKIAPLYLIHGDEPYFIDKIAEELEQRVVPAAEKGFNQFVLFGKDIPDVATILNYARRFPFMADRQLVLVKEAQQISGLDNKDKNGQLDAYASAPPDSTVLVLCYQGNFDARKSILKTIDKGGVVVHSKKMYDNKLPDWIASVVHEQGAKISHKAIQMLVENIGNDLKRLSSEIDKILINCKLGEEISASIIEKYVGISKEYNIFELQKALTARDVLKSTKITNYLAANTKENPLPALIINLFNFFCKVLTVHSVPQKTEANVASALGVNPFFAKDYLAAARQYSVFQISQIISSIRKADNTSKGIESGSLDDEFVLKQLVFEILHC